MKRILRLCATFVILFTGCIYADEALLAEDSAKEFINTMVKNHGFSNKEVVATLKEAKIHPKILSIMDRPYEKKPWDTYLETMLSAERLNKGVEFWQKNSQALEAAQKKFGVPANIIVAILGVESFYGARQGNYRVLDSLATLAFYYPRRAKFFQKELKEYLLLCREQNVPPAYYRGSYAGAIGQPQFMPSSYRFYAINAQGENKSDLINKNQDVIASIANYFHKHGWKINEDVATLANVTTNEYKKLTLNNRKALYDFNHLQSLGIKPKNPILNADSKKIGLIELNKQTGEEIWMAHPNFYVITRYNTNSQYAMAVHLLSEQLQKQWIAKNESNKAFA